MKNIGRGQRGDLHEGGNNAAVVGGQGDVTNQSRAERKVKHHRARPVDLSDADPEMARIGQRGQRRGILSRVGTSTPSPAAFLFMTPGLLQTW